MVEFIQDILLTLVSRGDDDRKIPLLHQIDSCVREPLNVKNLRCEQGIIIHEMKKDEKYSQGIGPRHLTPDLY